MAQKTIQKIIKFIENNIHLDSNCDNSLFCECLDYMETAEEICNEVEKSNSMRDSKLKFLEILSNIINSKNIVEDGIIEWGEMKRVSPKDERRAETKLLLKLQEFHQKLETIFDETKIIDSLVKRHNNFLKNNGLAYLQTNRETALDEFKRPNKGISVAFSKITFWINKLTKYINYTEYYDSYKADASRSKKCNDKRLQFISKIKTDFLQELFNSAKEQSLEFEDCQTLKDKKDKYKELLNKIATEYQDQYSTLFNDTFTKLNLYEDLERLIYCNIIKEELYALKSIISSYAMASLLSTYYERHTVPNGITEWGITNDEKGRYILNVCVENYPLPISIHFHKSQLSQVLEGYKKKSKNNYLKPVLKIPKYDSITTNNQKIVSTNILCALTAKQKKRLEDHAKTDSKNGFVQKINKQINGINPSIEDVLFLEISNDDLLR